MCIRDDRVIDSKYFVFKVPLCYFLRSTLSSRNSVHVPGKTPTPGCIQMSNVWTLRPGLSYTVTDSDCSFFHPESLDTYKRLILEYKPPHPFHVVPKFLDLQSSFDFLSEYSQTAFLFGFD